MCYGRTELEELGVRPASSRAPTTTDRRVDDGRARTAGRLTIG